MPQATGSNLCNHMVLAAAIQAKVASAVMRAFSIFLWCTLCSAGAWVSAPPSGAAVQVISLSDSSLSPASNQDGCREKKVLKRIASKQQSYACICSLPVHREPLVKKRSFCYYAYPLKGSYYPSIFDSVAVTMGLFLSQYGTVRHLSLQELLYLLSENAHSTASRVYLILPLEIRSSRKEKKAVVQRFVNLDGEGNFVPTNESHTITSSGVETRIRFVAVDTHTRTIVFDLWSKGKAGSGDFGEEGFQDRGESPSRRHSDQSYRSVMYIVKKVKRVFKRQLK